MGRITSSALASKLVCAAAIIAIAQWFIGPITTSWHRPEVEEKAANLSLDGDDILFLGDSTLVDWEQREEPSTPELLDELVEGYEVYTIAHAAYAAPMFRAIVDRAIADGQRPTYIVLPINVRTFSRAWQMNPAYQFAKERMYLAERSALFNAAFVPMAVFGGHDLSPVNEREYQSLLIADAFDESINDEERYSILAQSYYMEELEIGNAYLSDLRAIADACEANGIRLVAYITPINLRDGDDAVDGFSERVRANAAVVESELDVLPLLDEIPRDAFRTLDAYPEDHPNVLGRRRIAATIAGAIE